VSRVASKPDQVSNLDNLVKARVRLLVLVKKMARSIADALDRRLIKGQITEEEWGMASYLAKTKYSSPAWNLRFNEKVGEEGSLMNSGNGGIE
ncbi:hypothetical protein KGY79_12345, partial [Candidatus Bipolaricaulota bacterium]|nr:hypothetical protein [Candidatus Bipolaricaulota bacterium]